MFTLSSTTKTNLHQMQTFNTENNNNNNHLHDAVFSPYLNIKEGSFIAKIGESSQTNNPFINHRNSPLHQVEKAEEIGVFGAEKYFNRGEVDTPRPSTKYLPQRKETMAIETRKYQVEYGTPSISSVSTWNSQNALLKSGVRNSIGNSKEKEHAKSVLSSLRLKCSCSDKNSVDINDHASEISFNNKTSKYGAVQGKTTPKKVFNLGLDDDLSVRIRKPSSEILINKDVYFQKQEKLRVGLNNEKNSLASNSRNHLVQMQNPLDGEKTPRKSLEVFGSPNPILINTKRDSLTNDKRLIFPKMEEIDNANYDDDDDDAASDASSDLSEIESLKGKPSNNNFLTRQTSDAASSCLSPNCYAPSEASIEWSVVTASAAVMSDCEDQMSEFTIRSPIRTPLKPKVAKETPRRRPGMLLGCKSHKAVRVSGDAFITYEKQSLSPKISSRNKNNTNSQVARFPGETNYGARRHGQQHGYTTPPLQASNSPHASKLLYI